MRRRLIANTVRFPEAKHFVIAHSHGGNIAIDAIGSDPQLRSRIAGIICLSTPFLLVSKRQLHVRSTTATAVVFGLISLGLGGIPVAHWTANFSGNSGILGEEFQKLWVAVALLSYVVVVAFLCLLLSAIYESVTHRIIVSKTLDGEFPPILVIRSAGDEASAGLATFQFVARAANMAWLRVERVAAMMELALRNRIVLFGTTFVAGGISAAVSVGRIGHDFIWAIVLLAAMSGFCALVFDSLVAWIPRVVSGLLYLPVALVSFLTLLPFAPAYALASWQFEVNVEATPPGEWPQLLLALEHDQHELSHSAPYSDPRALRRIAEWIRSH
jgi:hypothetical protein